MLWGFFSYCVINCFIIPDEWHDELYVPGNGPPSGSCTWKIDKFSTIYKPSSLYSNIFDVRAFKWCICISLNSAYLSVRLELVDHDLIDSKSTVHARFGFSIIHPTNPQLTIRKDTNHTFTSFENCRWGFPTFISLEELHDNQYVADDKFTVEAHVAVHKVIDYWSHDDDSKKETGYVGLNKNQGATCYLNPLLQSLYHLPLFRKNLFLVPTTEEDEQSQSILLAVRNLFYRLQCSDTSVATEDLIKLFQMLNGVSYETFNRVSYEKLNKLLYEIIEDKMKGTMIDSAMRVDYNKSTKNKSRHGIQLDVKGCRDVYASFDKYVEEDALFSSFPPVLQLELRRFEYDFTNDAMIKINDRYEFPFQLDLDRENRKYLSPDADKNIRNLYTLYSVLAHRGGALSGHCYAYIRPSLSDQWFKFDDEHVTKEDMKMALEGEYGGEEELPRINPDFNNPFPLKFTKCSNAYMLVYVRECDKETIIYNVDHIEPISLSFKSAQDKMEQRRKREQDENERKRKEKDEVNSYTIIKVARSEDLFEQIGKNLHFDLVDLDKVRSFRIQRKMPFSSFQEEVEKAFGIPVECQRFWLFAKRDNHKYRPFRPLTRKLQLGPIEQLREFTIKEHGAELRLFLEVKRGKDFRPVPPQEITKRDILLFFKLYDPLKEEEEKLRYVGSLFVKEDDTPSDILKKLNSMAGFADDEKIELYEEIRFEPNLMIEYIDKERTFRRSRQVNLDTSLRLQDGDIVCFQKQHLPDENQCSYPNLRSFLERKHERQDVRFRSLEKPEKDEFCLVLSKFSKYDDIVRRVASHIDLDDPSKIRLTRHNCYAQLPFHQAINYGEVVQLADILHHGDLRSDILFYEVLDIPLPELQGLKTLKVAFCDAIKKEEVINIITLPKKSTVSDVINELKTKVELTDPSAQLRLLQMFCNKIIKIFQHDEKIENVYDQYWTLRAEEVPTSSHA